MGQRADETQVLDRTADNAEQTDIGRRGRGRGDLDILDGVTVAVKHPGEGRGGTRAEGREGVVADIDVVHEDILALEVVFDGREIGHGVNAGVPLRDGGLRCDRLDKVPGRGRESECRHDQQDGQEADERLVAER